MTKNEDSIPDFNHVKSSLKEYLDSIEELKSKIKAIVDSFNPTKKKALKPKLESVGLTTKFSTFDNIDDLNKFYEIVQQ